MAESDVVVRGRDSYELDVRVESERVTLERRRRRKVRIIGTQKISKHTHFPPMLFA